MTGHTIVVIDDEPQIRRIVRRAFEQGDARVLDATTGREGLDIAAVLSSVLLDYGLMFLSYGLTSGRELRCERWEPRCSSLAS